MFQNVFTAAILIVFLPACASTADAVQQGARGVKLAALDVKDKSRELKDKALDVRDGAADFFDVPPDYHGRGQTVCGFLSYEEDSHNIYPDAFAFQHNTKGFGVMPGAADHRDLQRLNEQYVCVIGEVVYRGCGKERTCASSDFPYAVRVDRVGG